MKPACRSVVLDPTSSSPVRMCVCDCVQFVVLYVDLQKSLLYLESSVVRLAGSTTAGRRLGHVPSR